jgi:hypothetical protein
MSLIPQSTKDTAKAFWGGVFSNDAVYNQDGSMTMEPSRMLIDGRNSKGELVHTDATFNKWLQHEANPKAIKDLIISNAIEYTAEEMQEQINNPNSIWHLEQVDV